MDLYVLMSVVTTVQQRFCKTKSMDKDQLIQLLRSTTQPIDAKGIQVELESRLSTPFFKFMGPFDYNVAAVVRRCWYEVHRAEEVTHGPQPKQFLQVLLQLAHRWGTDAESIIYGPAEKALFRYNEALVNSLVLEAIKEP